jgi:hypothetical protein
MNSLWAALIVSGIAVAGCGRGQSAQTANAARDAKSDHATGAADARVPTAFDAGMSGLRDAQGAPTNADGGQMGAPSVSIRPTRLELDFTTVSLNGKYAPHNGGVAWVADAQGKWVHTFEFWIGPFYGALKAYFMAGGPNYVAIAPNLSLAPVPPDVITSATLHTHKTHAGESWNLKDANGNEIPDGNYSIVIEVTEQNPEAVYEFPFVKAGKPAQWTPTDAGNLKDVRIALQ